MIRTGSSVEQPAQQAGARAAAPVQRAYGTSSGAPAQVLPNLLVIGAMKGGTTSLWEYLGRHPSVHMSPTKEIHFFDRDDRWARGASWYARHFADAGPEHVVVGEATPAYTRFPLHQQVPARAASLLPGARLVYVLRDPIARIRSHYLHHRTLGIEPLPFAQAVVEHSTYVDTSRYALQIEQWLEHFPREQLLVITSERLRSSHAETMRRVYAFLGVDDSWVPDATELHRTEDKYVPRPLVSRLRASPLGERLVEGVPDALRPALLKAWGLTRHRPDTGGAELTPQLRSALAALLHEDTARLAPYLDGEELPWVL